MKYQTISKLKEEKFRRLTGVKRPTFDKMAEILRQPDLTEIKMSPIYKLSSNLSPGKAYLFY
jgi:hypothetical protein